MERTKLAQLRHAKHWTLEQAAERIGVSINTLSRWEHGIQHPHGYNLQRLCAAYDLPTLDSQHIQDTTEDMNRRQTLQFFGASGLSLLASAAPAGLWTDDLLTVYTRGVTACQNLHFSDNSRQVEAILPLYCHQTAALASQPSPVQIPAAKLAAQTHRLACELATDREDFREAQQAGQYALEFAQLARDVNLQVASLISLANIGFHRKLSTAALHSYIQAVSLLNEHVTPLLRGRVYAGLAEVYAMRKDVHGSMRAMGLAYDSYPVKCEDDPAFPYLHASRYSLYVFGDVQSRLFLGQPKEAHRALMAMQKETNEPQMRPSRRLDMLYYQASIQIQQKELKASATLLSEAVQLAKSLGSRLYFNKLAVSYQSLSAQWPKEPAATALEEAFQPW